MPDSGWVTAAVAVNDASRGGALSWQNPAGAAQGSGSAEAHNQSASVKDTVLLAAWPPADIVPQGVDVTRIEWDVTISAFTFETVNDLFIFKDGVLGDTDHVNAVNITTQFLTVRLHWDDSLDAGQIWQKSLVPDDFGGHPNGMGIALRMGVRAEKTGYVATIRFRVHWTGGPPLEQIVGGGAGAGLKPTLIAGSRLEAAVADGEGQGLTPALVSSFGRWTSPAISFDPLRLARAATISWDETLPGGTAVSCETRLLPAQGDPGPWAEVANGGDLEAVLAAGDLAGQTLEVAFVLTTTALPATPRVDNLAVDAAGAYGLSQGFYRNPLTGHVSPLSMNDPTDDGVDGDDTFAFFCANPVPASIYDAPEIDIGFDDRARLWAEVDSAIGPGLGGLVGLKRFVAYRQEAEELPMMHELTTEEAELRYARFRIELDNQATGAVVRRFAPTVDQLERRITDTVAVAPGGTVIDFDPLFHTLPGVEVTAASVAGSPRYGTWEDRTTASVKIHVFDAANNSVGGEATYTIIGV